MDQRSFNGFPFPSMSPEARVALIARSTPCSGSSRFSRRSFSTSRSPRRIPHDGNDLAYIKQLATDVGHAFYIEPGPLPGMNTAYWGPEIAFGVPQPALNINMDAHTNVDSLSFSRHGENVCGPLHPLDPSQARSRSPFPTSTCSSRRSARSAVPRSSSS